MPSAHGILDCAMHSINGFTITCITNSDTYLDANIERFCEHQYVSTRIRKIPVQEIFREMAPIPGNIRTYPKVCVGKGLEYC
jgi:hypothetical protein